MTGTKTTPAKFAPAASDGDANKPAPRHSAEKSSPWRAQPQAAADRSLPLANFDFLDSEEFVVSDHIGEAMAAFQGIVIPTPQQMTAVSQMNSLRIMGLKQPAGEMRRGARYIHPSGSGKSTCAKIIDQYLTKFYGCDPSRKPVLHVTLSTTGTPRSLGSSILTAVGDSYSTKGDAELLLKRVREAIREYKVELLVIDELNHIKGKSLATDAANTIKNLLTEGVVPVVMMGTSAAENLVKSNRELRIRCQPKVYLRPYDPEVGRDLAHWSKFVDLIDKEMVARDIVAHTAGLKDVAYELCKASSGLIGEFHGIMLAALEAALQDGDDHISHDCLVAAVDEWAVSDGIIDNNPMLDEQESGSSPENDASEDDGDEADADDTAEEVEG